TSSRTSASASSSRCSGSIPSSHEGAAMDPFVAEIRIFGFNFAPAGWALCDGQLLPISQNTALFSLVGTFYGGDGQSTFALPDLDAITPIGAGQGSGLADHPVGQTSGTPEIALTQARLPPKLGGASQPIDNLEPSLPLTYVIR